LTAVTLVWSCGPGRPRPRPTRITIEVVTAVGGPTEWTYDMGDGIGMTVPRPAWYTHVVLSAPDGAALDEIRAALGPARRE
jgi:hypothetical protein